MRQHEQWPVAQGSWLLGLTDSCGGVQHRAKVIGCSRGVSRSHAKRVSRWIIREHEHREVSAEQPHQAETRSDAKDLLHPGTLRVERLQGAPEHYRLIR